MQLKNHAMGYNVYFSEKIYQNSNENSQKKHPY